MSVSAFPYGVFNPGGVEIDVSGVIGQSNAAVAPDESYAGIRFLPSGTWELMANDAIVGTDFSPPEASGTWLTKGSASQVWIERVLTTGVFNITDPGAGRHQLNVTRTFVRSHTGAVPGGSSTVVTFNFYDAASGGNLIGSSTTDLQYTSQKTI